LWATSHLPKPRKTEITKAKADKQFASMSAVMSKLGTNPTCKEYHTPARNEDDSIWGCIAAPDTNTNRDKEDKTINVLRYLR